MDVSGNYCDLFTIYPSQTTCYMPETYTVMYVNHFSLNLEERLHSEVRHKWIEIHVLPLH